MAENDNPPPEDESQKIYDVMRRATLDGMKDYDRERDEWEAAVKEQEKQRTESENDKPPTNNNGGLGALLLGGKRK